MCVYIAAKMNKVNKNNRKEKQILNHKPQPNSTMKLLQSLYNYRRSYVIIRTFRDADKLVHAIHIGAAEEETPAWTGRSFKSWI